ncbi:unnamed protein product [Allacma fusca]|uniref:HRDC domain-containing protein n=1 Tax=Allacma fusca TaxID=39272 RepID=A0A8J2NWF6_9HEXA|nr:unnamed protein product [Allacma fusca]
MEKWQWTTLILCGFGLFKEFRPSESFFTEYILEYKNITADVLIHDAYPVSTYSYLATLAVVFLVTDFLRYRNVVILEGAAYVATWIIMIWGQGLTALMFIESLYGLACSTEVAYYTYIYAKVDKDKYKKVTSYTYSAIFVGRFFAGVAAQVLVSYDLMNYHELNYISLTCVSIAFCFSLFLPSVKQSIYFYREDENDNTKAQKLSIVQRIRAAYPILWRDFKSAFSNPYVVKWSIWWAVATAGHLQVINYIQAMWETIAAYHSNTIYNGAVEATHTALSAVLAFGVGHVKLPWNKWGDTFLSITSAVAGAALIILSQTTQINIAYVCYVIFRTIFQVTITVASAEVAQVISEDSYGLIFGINTFVALSLQTILTLVVADRKGLEMKEKEQFLVYGSCYVILGGLYVFIAGYTFVKYGCKGQAKVLENNPGVQSRSGSFDNINDTTSKRSNSIPPTSPYKSDVTREDPEDSDEGEILKNGGKSTFIQGLNILRSRRKFSEYRQGGSVKVENLRAITVLWETDRAVESKWKVRTDCEDLGSKVSVYQKRLGKTKNIAGEIIKVQMLNTRTMGKVGPELGSGPGEESPPLGVPVGNDSFSPGQRGYLVFIDTKAQTPNMVDEIISFLEGAATDLLRNGDGGPEGIHGAEMGVMQPCNGEIKAEVSSGRVTGKSPRREGIGLMESPGGKRGSPGSSFGGTAVPKKTKPSQGDSSPNSPANSNDYRKPISKHQQKRKLFYEMQKKTEHMAKPQAKFTTPIINDDLPFVPKYPLILVPKEDPKSRKIYYEHPYQATILDWIPPPALMSNTKKNWSVPDIKGSQYFLVSSLTSLNHMMRDLHQATEISFDVEHSDRGYLGLTCLIQISTRYKDYIIDCFTLRDYLHCLNEVFTHPEILKVAHSAHCDIAYLQRDLGIYVVGLFDTCEAEKIITASEKSAGLAALLLKYFNIEADKRYQLADWRIRPLTSPMKDYARTDTHYLLKMYDFQKAELLRDHDYSLLYKAYENSKDICLIRYDKPDNTDWMRKHSSNFNNRQIYALSELNKKRNEVAIAEDDGIHFIASNKTLASLANALPSTWDEILDAIKTGGNLTEFIDLNRSFILRIMEAAREMPLEAPSTLKYNRNDSNRLVVGQVLKPKASHSVFLLSKTGSPSPCDVVYSVMKKCYLLKRLVYPKFLRRILPVVCTCEKETDRILETIQALIPSDYESKRILYGVSSNFAPKFEPELRRSVEELITTIRPNWIWVDDVNKAEHCIAVYNIGSVCGVSVIERFGEFNGFFLKVPT